MSAVPTETRSGTSEATLLRAAAAETVRNGYVLTGRNMRHVAASRADHTRPGAADHVRGAVRLRVRRQPGRRGTTAGSSWPASSPRAWSSTPPSGRGARERPPEGHRRAVPLAADVAAGGHLGRTVSDMVVGVATLVVTALCGLLVGWRVEGSAATRWSRSACWSCSASRCPGSARRSASSPAPSRSRKSAGLIWLFPLSLISTAFVSAENMPTPLREFAAWNPVSAVATSVRDLLGNPTPASLPQPDAWSLQHPTLYAVPVIAGRAGGLHAAGAGRGTGG